MSDDGRVDLEREVSGFAHAIEDYALVMGLLGVLSADEDHVPPELRTACPGKSQGL